MHTVFAGLTAPDIIKIIVFLLSALGVGLPMLTHLKGLSSDSAWGKVIAAAIHIVNQINAELKADPTVTQASLISAGVSELKSVFEEELTRAGLNGPMIDPVLTLLLQRLLAGLPPSLNGIVTEVVGGGVPEPPAVPAVPVKVSFARRVGVSGLPK
jgi:hypothetical protein